jgi:hypothetical protein
LGIFHARSSGIAFWTNFIQMYSYTCATTTVYGENAAQNGLYMSYDWSGHSRKHCISSNHYIQKYLFPAWIL